MILDAHHSIFIWFGALSTRQEQQESIRIAREYLEGCPNDRDVDTPVVKIRQGLEPPNFTGFFGSWDEERWDPEKLYSQQEEQYQDQTALMTNGHGGGGGVAGCYPYSVLIGDPLPANVDPSRKEEYLSDREFQQVLGMDKGAWEALPSWKRVAAKRAKNLF